MKLQERYYDDLNGFVASKRESNAYLTEKMILDFAKQLLSVLGYLHSKNFIHAPGEINSYRIYFTQMYDEIFLDIGISSSLASPKCLISQSKILNTDCKYISLFWLKLCHFYSYRLYYGSIYISRV
jgi:serine/threonine protein kinase